MTLKPHTKVLTGTVHVTTATEPTNPIHTTEDGNVREKIPLGGNNAVGHCNVHVAPSANITHAEDDEAEIDALLVFVTTVNVALALSASYSLTWRWAQDELTLLLLSDDLETRSDVDTTPSARAWRCSSIAGSA